MLMTKVNKQINKQQEVAHVGAVWCCAIYRVCYAMHQSMWKSIRDALEMHWKSTESDTQGHTLTPPM